MAAYGLLESEVEDFIYDNCDDALPFNYDFQWLGRQVSVASGIIDLLGVEYGHPPHAPFSFYNFFVIELKAVPLTSKHIAQVCRYGADVESVFPWELHGMCCTRKVLIGPSGITDQLIYEADAMDVELYTFTSGMEFHGPHYIDPDRSEYGRNVNTAMFNRLMLPQINETLTARKSEVSRG